MYSDLKKNLALLEGTQLVKDKAAAEPRKEVLDIMSEAFKLTEEDVATNKDMSNRDKLPKETELFKGEEKEETTEPIDGGKVKPADGKEKKPNVKESTNEVDYTALAKSLPPEQAARFVKYMKTRNWPGGGPKYDIAYAKTWLARFKRGEEWEYSDSEGRNVLREIDSDYYITQQKKQFESAVKESGELGVDNLVAFYRQPEHGEFFKREVTASKDLPKEQRYHILHDHLADYAKERGQQTEGVNMYAVVNQLLAEYDIAITYNGPANDESKEVVKCRYCGHPSEDNSGVCAACDKKYESEEVVKCRYCGHPSEDNSGVCAACDKKYESKIPSDILQAEQDKLLKDLLEKNGINERTTWIDLGFDDTPNLTGHKLEYIPTGEKFAIAGADEKFIQLAQELPADSMYIGIHNSKEIAVGDGLAYSHKWRLLDPQGKEVTIKQSYESKLPDIEKDSPETVIKKLTEMADDPANLVPQPNKQYLGASGQNVFYAVFQKDDNGVITAAALYDAVGDKIKEIANERNVDNIGMLVDIVHAINLDTVSFKLLTELGIIKQKEEEKPEEPKPEEPKPEDEAPAEPEAQPAPKEPGEAAGTEEDDTEAPIESRKVSEARRVRKLREASGLKEIDAFWSRMSRKEKVAALKATGSFSDEEEVNKPISKMGGSQQDAMEDYIRMLSKKATGESKRVECIMTLEGQDVYTHYVNDTELEACKAKFEKVIAFLKKELPGDWGYKIGADHNESRKVREAYKPNAVIFSVTVEAVQLYAKERIGRELTNDEMRMAIKGIEFAMSEAMVDVMKTAIDDAARGNESKIPANVLTADQDKLIKDLLEKHGLKEDGPSYKEFKAVVELSALGEMTTEQVAKEWDEFLDTFENSGIEIIDSSLIQESNEGKDQRGVRDGTGPCSGSAMQVGGRGRRRLAGEQCPMQADKAQESLAIGKTVQLAKAVEAFTGVNIEEVEVSGPTGGRAVQLKAGAYIVEDIVQTPKGRMLLLQREGGQEYMVREDSLADRKAVLLAVAKAKRATPEQMEVLQKTGEPATNFNVRVSKEEAMDLLKAGVNDIIMCKEYGEDEDWVALAPDEVETIEDSPEYQTFELWLDESVKAGKKAARKK